MSACARRARVCVRVCVRARVHVHTSVFTWVLRLGDYEEILKSQDLLTMLMVWFLYMKKV